MLVYWTLFWFPLLGVFAPKRLVSAQARATFALTCIAYAAIMGLRDQVGGDWFAYEPMFHEMSTMDVDEIIGLKDPAYYLLNWAVGQADGSIYIVNLICAVIMMSGVYRFCRSLPNPWLALLVAAPYMLIVVGMGYTRQAVALGAAMFGLVYLARDKKIIFVASVLFGALFHSSAVLLIPIAGLAASKRRGWTILWVMIAFVLAYIVLLQSQSDDLWKNYVTDTDARGNVQHSYGAFERALMNAVAAVSLLAFRKRLFDPLQNNRLWIIFSCLALASLPFVFFASTAVDRIALYLLPLQLFVFSRMPNLAHNATGRAAIVVGVVVYYAAVQFVWLNYAVMKDSWVPYHFMPLE